MMSAYYLIEHSSRGVYVGHEAYGDGPKWNVPRPRFRWSIPRSGAEQFQSEPHAKLRFAKVQQEVPAAYLLRFSRAARPAYVNVHIWRNERWEPYS